MVGFADDDRGVSEVLGAILVFGLVLTIVALVQMHAVPAANANVEANHYEEVEEDLGQLQGAISRTATGGAGESVRMNLGTQYPSRFILVNPPPVSGTIRTSQVQSVQLTNLRAVNEETADYLDSSGTPLTFDTQSIIYAPEYNQLNDPGTTVFETGVRYKQFESGRNIQEKGLLISERTITLITIDGDLSDSAITASSLTTVPLSSSRSAVGVRNQGGQAITIEIFTELSEEDWKERVLDEEFDSPTTPPQPDKFVSDIRCTTGVRPDQPCNGLLAISLETGETYDLRMAKVGIGSGFTRPDEHYITDAQGDDTSIPEGGRQKLVVQVRDRFNNPESGVEVQAIITNPAGTPPLTTEDVTPTSAFTDSDGKAAFIYEAPQDVVGSQQAEIEVTFGSGTARETVVFNVEVMDTTVNVIQTICNNPNVNQAIKNQLGC